jgi:putative ABC transport system substrate-binding protein
VHASSQSELDNAVAACVQMGAGGLVVTADALFFNRQKEIVTLAARHAIPAIYEWRDFVLAGGLASYGSSITDALHQARRLHGKNPWGCKNTRPACRPDDQIRVRDQSKDGEGARY